jgi:hypothetical protein
VSRNLSESLAQNILPTAVLGPSPLCSRTGPCQWMPKKADIEDRASFNFD